MLSWASKASLLGGGGGGMGMGMGGHNASEVLLHQQLQQQLAVRMPRVVPDQKDKFENDELFRKLSRESEIRYSDYKERPHAERQARFISDCREGFSLLAFVGSGISLPLTFTSNSWSERADDRLPIREFVDFEKDLGKVYLKSQFIMNGVCVVFRGWVDLQRLDGTGWMEFDEQRAEVEDGMLRDQIEQYNRHLRDFEQRHRHFADITRRHHAEHDVSSSRSHGQGNQSHNRHRSDSND